MTQSFSRPPTANTAKNIRLILVTIINAFAAGTEVGIVEIPRILLRCTFANKDFILSELLVFTSARERRRGTEGPGGDNGWERSSPGILMQSGHQYNATQYVISQFLIPGPDLRDLNVPPVTRQ